MWVGHQEISEHPLQAASTKLLVQFIFTATRGADKYLYPLATTVAAVFFQLPMMEPMHCWFDQHVGSGWYLEIPSTGQKPKPVAWLLLQQSQWPCASGSAEPCLPQRFATGQPAWS